MNNITYTIRETSDEITSKSCSDISLNYENENILTGLKRTFTNYTENITYSEYMAREIDYDLNYTSKYLIQILEFYGLKKGRINKKEIISKIVDFEMNEINNSTVEKRKQLFNNFIELKNNAFFSKFIVGNF